MRSRRNHRQEFLTIYRVSAAVPGSGEQNTINVYCVTYLIDVCIRVDLTQAMWDDVSWVGKAAVNISALLNGRLKVPQISVVASTRRTMVFV